MSDLADVPALIPLSLLEAIRNLDTPLEDGLDELSSEIVAKRFGLSHTVAAQIARYQKAAERSETVPRDEAVSVFRLVGRRPDADLVFADAGRRAARYAARASGLSARSLLRITGSAFGRRMGRRASTQVTRRTFHADLRFASALPEIRLVAPLSVEALPEGQGCAFYGASFGELLRCLVGFEGIMKHETCRGRGDGDCAWRGALAEGYE